MVMLGAMLVICDVNEYRRSIKDFKIPIVLELFEKLHALCNLLVVVPENLKQVCSGEQLVGLDNEYINQNPKEYWNILKSLKNKTEKDEIPEVLKDEEVLIKHFQDQGKPSSINNAFMIDIESQLKLLENNIDFKAETDAPISCSEVKKNVDVLPQSVFTSKQYCKIHTEKILDLVCTQHDTLYCRSCMTDKHRNCDSVLPLEDASRNVDESAMLVDTICELDGIAVTLRIFEKDRTSASSEVEDAALVATTTVSNLKDRILKRIDEMEEKIITEIEDIKSKKNIRDNFETTTKFGSFNQKFVMIHSFKTKIKELQERLQQMLSVIVNRFG
ncbi:EXOC5 [Mytilus coruscus]|uniref:EXOC5 n=1 Tax=Mytilus coruscus TaxID=42192 RepID=A0A6J8AD56_MYTCO|nr:EXOC5 [Mytilus coruscus]